MNHSDLVRNDVDILHRCCQIEWKLYVEVVEGWVNVINDRLCWTIHRLRDAVLLDWIWMRLWSKGWSHREFDVVE